MFVIRIKEVEFQWGINTAYLDQSVCSTGWLRNSKLFCAAICLFKVTCEPYSRLVKISSYIIYSTNPNTVTLPPYQVILTQLFLCPGDVLAAQKHFHFCSFVPAMMTPVTLALWSHMDKMSIFNGFISTVAAAVIIMLTMFNQAFTKYPPTLLYWKQILTCASRSRSAITLFAKFSKRDIFTHLLLSCGLRGQYQHHFGGSSMSLTTGVTCTSQGNPYLTLTQLLPPRRKHRQLMLSVPQLQPDLHQIALCHTSNSHTVNSVHWHFQDLIQGLTVVSPPLQRLQLQGEGKRECFSLM